MRTDALRSSSIASEEFTEREQSEDSDRSEERECDEGEIEND